MTAMQTAVEMKKAKTEVWEEVHSAKTQCPHCQKSLTVRTLRWKHTCKRRGGATAHVLLDADVAERRRQELERKVVETLNRRLCLREEGRLTEASGGSAGQSFSSAPL